MGIPANHPAILEAQRRGMIPAVAKPKRKSPDVRTASRRRWSLTLTLACRVVSEANRRDHWTVMRRRKEVQNEELMKSAQLAGVLECTPEVAWMWTGYSCKVQPVVVTWINIHKPGAEMDDDNLRRAFKGLRDSLAKLFGVDDADPRIVWKYEQRAGEPCVEVRIETGV